MVGRVFAISAVLLTARAVAFADAPPAETLETLLRGFRSHLTRLGYADEAEAVDRALQPREAPPLRGNWDEEEGGRSERNVVWATVRKARGRVKARIDLDQLAWGKGGFRGSRPDDPQYWNVDGWLSFDHDPAEDRWQLTFVEEDHYLGTFRRLRVVAHPRGLRMTERIREGEFHSFWSGTTIRTTTTDLERVEDQDMATITGTRTELERREDRNHVRGSLLAPRERREPRVTSLPARRVAMPPGARPPQPSSSKR